MGGFLFSKVSPSDHSSGLLTVTLRPNSRAARLSWKRHHNHMKRQREYHIVLLKDEDDLCEACAHAGQAGRKHLHTQTKPEQTDDLLRQQKEVGWESSPEQLPARNSITIVGACVKEREEEREEIYRILYLDCKFVSYLSDCCYLLELFWVLLLMNLTAIRCALHLFSCGSLERRNKEMTHMNLHE